MWVAPLTLFFLVYRAWGCHRERFFRTSISVITVRFRDSLSEANSLQHLKNDEIKLNIYFLVNRSTSVGTSWENKLISRYRTLLESIDPTNTVWWIHRCWKWSPYSVFIARCGDLSRRVEWLFMQVCFPEYTSGNITISRLPPTDCKPTFAAVCQEVN